MTFDTKVPSELKKIQKWFASIITRPIGQNNEIMPMGPSGKPINKEAKQFILPSPFLKPFERIEIYNQQYWWRLLNVLQDNFPLTLRLFGYFEFNQKIAFPYLVAYPPSHWSLSLLGNHLAEWAKEHYLEEDRELVLNAILIDDGYHFCFFAEQKNPIDFAAQNPEDLCSLKLCLQPHVHLFEFSHDFSSFRFNMLKENPDYWQEHEFPKLRQGKFYFILYRNYENFAVLDTLSPVGFHILKLFQQGSSIDGVSDWIEAQNKKIKREAEKNLQQWFQHWGALDLLHIKQEI